MKHFIHKRDYLAASCHGHLYALFYRIDISKSLKKEESHCGPIEVVLICTATHAEKYGGVPRCHLVMHTLVHLTYSRE